MVADEVRREAAAVEEQDGLVAGVDGRGERLRELRREHAVVVAHVHELELRRQRAVHALAQVGVQRHACEALHARRGRAEDDHGAARLRTPAGHRARVVGGLVLLLVRGVVLLVDDDQPQVDERREHRRARADDDAHLPAGDGGVGEQPLPRGETRVQHGDPGAGEPPLDARDGLPREADLGHEQEDRAAGLERRLRRLEVHLGLAAPGDAVQQDLVAGLGLAEDRVERAPLLREQVGHVRERRARAQPRRLGRGGRRDAVRHRPLGSLVRDGVRGSCVCSSRVLDDDGSRLDQPPQPLRGEAAGRAQLALLERAGLLEKAQRRALAGSEPRRRLRAAAQRPARRRDADHVHPVRDAQPALAPVALGGRRETARTGAAGRPVRAARSRRPPRPHARASVSSYWRTILSAPVGGQTSASALANDVR